MTEVKVGNLTIQPLNKNHKEIHPAIGVVDNIAYVGVWIPCKITGPKGKVAYKDLLWLITSRRQQTLANDEELRKHAWIPSYKPIHFQTAWPYKGLRKTGGSFSTKAPIVDEPGADMYHS